MLWLMVWRCVEGDRNHDPASSPGKCSSKISPSPRCVDRVSIDRHNYAVLFIWSFSFE